jgi:cysteine-rich repeat protein
MKKCIAAIIVLAVLVPSVSALGSCLWTDALGGTHCLLGLEPGMCPGSYFWGPGICEPTCANGHTEAGEECDDGNTAEGDGCSGTCTVTSVCGNGILEWGENCDDGNTADGDGCSGTCSFCREVHCSRPELPCDPFLPPFPPGNLCELLGHQCTGGIDHDCDGFWEGVDCDDYTATIFPGAAEIPCNAVDEDCNGSDTCGPMPIPEFPLEVISRWHVLRWSSCSAEAA